MAIEEMTMLNMTFDRSELDQVLFDLKGTKYFYPQSASKIVHNVKDVQALDKDNVYTSVVDRLIQVASDMQLELNKDLNHEKTLNLEKTNEYLSNLEEEIKKIIDIRDELRKEKEENDKTLELLNQITSSHINLDDISQCQYVTARFGRFERRHLDKVKYYDGRPYVFYKLKEEGSYVWCCYLVTNNLLLEVDNIFKALGFEEIKIPSFVHGNADEAKKELRNESQAMQEYILRMDQKMTVLRETHKVDLLKMYSTASFLQRIEEYKVFVVDFKNKCSIYGFIPKRCIEDFKVNFENIKTMEYQQLPSDILGHRDVIAPTIVHNAKFVEPFEVVSKVKQSDVVDTTIAFALLYYFVFFVFMGDLGVGALFMLLGLFMRKKKMGPLFCALGIATFIGGLLSGTLFYYQSLYTTVALPLTTTFKLIDGIVLLGIGTYTINAFKKMALTNSKVEKIFSTQGICGLIVVYGLMVYFGGVYEAHINMPVMPFAIVVVACLVLILFKSILNKKKV